MLPVSLDCPFFIIPSVFSNMYLSCVLCTLREYRRGNEKKDNPEKLATLGTQDTGQINAREYRRGNKKGQSRETGNIRYTSLTCICPVSCVLYVASFSGLSFFITPSEFSNMYLSCVLCTLCCQFFWIVFFFITP
jgi:hypothetical protein